MDTWSICIYMCVCDYVCVSPVCILSNFACLIPVLDSIQESHSDVCGIVLVVQN